VRRLRVLAIGAAVAVAGTVAVVIAWPGNAEAATFAVVNSWNNGYQAQVSVVNGTSSATTSWKVELTLPAGTSISGSWNATRAADGSTDTFTPADWNGKLAPGASTSFGFVAAGPGRPTGCQVNGHACGTSTGPPSGPPTTAPVTRPATAPTTAPATTATTRPPTTAPTTRPPKGTTPLAINGRLHVCGVHLCNQYDKAIQLRGMSTHGLQYAANCYNDASLDALADDWHADLLRIAMYVQEGGYATHPAGFTDKVDSLVDKAQARGMYAIVDFHILNPGDPTDNLARAKTFFAAVSKRNAGKKNVLYEIANEPNGVSWATIRSYAQQVIPVIRANDPHAVVIVGTRGWSSLGVSDGSNSTEVTNDPVPASNIMYTFHFYAASHGANYRAEVQRAAARLPLFVTEFGTVSASGGGATDTAGSTAWLNLLDQLKISYANWTFSDVNESSAALKPGTCSGRAYAGTSVLTPSGAFVRRRIRTPDSFPTS
jgi:endoglucanase